MEQQLRKVEKLALVSPSESCFLLGDRDRMISYVTYETVRGMLSFSVKYPPEFLSRLKFDAGMGNFTHYSSIIRKLETFQKVAAGKDGKVVLAIGDSETIVGYIACWYPDQGERWSKLGELIYELAAIEVSRNFRRLGIARQMIATVLSQDFFEDKISYISSFVWHWDLDGTVLTPAMYRKMMVNLMEGYGFQECYTNEPNVAIKRENLFMARIGSRVSKRDMTRFRNLRFGLTEP
jgi:acetoin utilization protein AcuA